MTTQSLEASPVLGRADLSPEEQTRLRAAMLSIYYDSLGREFESRGAPSILLPSEIDRLPLSEALDVVNAHPEREWEAMWTLVRGSRASRSAQRESTLEDRYPKPLRTLAASRLGFELNEFDERRTRYRAGAFLFASALVAYMNGQMESFRVLVDLVKDRPTDENGPVTPDAFTAFASATSQAGALGEQPAGGVTPAEYLDTLLLDDGDERERERTRKQLSELEQEVGMSLFAFVDEFADALAFVECANVKTGAEVCVYPAASVAVQHSDTLTTRITISALVKAKDFTFIWKSIDPRYWSTCSDVFGPESRFVAGPFDLEGVDGPTEREIFGGGEGPWHFLESVNLAWGLDATQVGLFKNILRVDRFRVDNLRKSVSFEFGLDRCVSSRMLWDERAGGIVVDEGFVRARCIGEGLWRVTTQKLVRFSDRTPYSGRVGWIDFGQLLNLLAPATLTLWLESEMYSAGCARFRDRVLAEARVEGYR